MSDSQPASASRAVFLSYAREDGAAAQRIAEALRSHGVEVWFDKNELRGGEAWDQKIRRQIADCALFLPIISAHTQARSKGYFRLEWKLAVEQTHLMLEGVPYLAPVVIDDTAESGAAVPAEFMRVQWTRLPGALPTPEFVAQVKRLVDAPRKPAGSRSRETLAGTGGTSSGQTLSTSATGTRVPGWVWGVVAAAMVVGVGAYFALRPASKENAAVASSSKSEIQNSKSIAVLAFTDLSQEKDGEYFSDGISEELLNVLAKVPGLKVSARTSAFYFKGKQVPMAEIAKQLNVAYVVEGSVRKLGTKVRITAQLIKADDGFHVWSDNFDRELKDIFAVQDEIAGVIAQNLQLKLGGASRAAKTVNPEAHRLVLEGRHFWNLRTPDALARAEAVYTQALKLDPQFAEAHAGLADVWMIRGWYRSMAGGTSALVATDFTRAKAEVQAALKLSPDLAEPFATVGAVLMLEGNFDESAQQFTQAFALNPNYAVAHHWYSILLGLKGDLEASGKHRDRSVSLDPVNPNAIWNYTIYSNICGRFDDTVRTSERALTLRPGFIPIISEQAWALWNLGRNAEAIAAALAIGRDLVVEPRWWADSEAIYVLSRAGLKAEATDHAGRLFARLSMADYRSVFALIAIGRGDEALDMLGTVPLTAIQRVYWHPMWDPWREDPRLRQLLVRLNCLDEYKRARAEQTSVLRARNDELAQSSRN